MPLNVSVSLTCTGVSASENLKAFCTSSLTILLKYSSDIGTATSTASSFKSFRRPACVGLGAGDFFDERRGLFGFADPQGVDIFRVGGDQFQLRVDQKIFDQPFQALAGLENFLAHLGDFARLEGGGGSGEQFGVGDDAVERRAHLVRHHQADVVAQMGELALGLVADGLGFFQARLHGGVKHFGRERLGQVIIRAQFHAVPHAGVVRHAGHQDERDGGGRRLGAQRGQREIAVHLAHVDIAEDEVGQFCARLLDAVMAVVRLDDFIAALPQRELDHFAQPFFIINDQDFFHDKYWSN